MCQTVRIFFAVTVFVWIGSGHAQAANIEPHVDIAYPDRNTCTLDIPWDWPHRCPPAAGSFDPPSRLVGRRNVPGCSAQSVAVRMRDGRARTVSIVRCP